MASKAELERKAARVEGLERRLEDAQSRIEAVRARIEVMYEPHTHPQPWDGLRLGNGLPARWYCDDCRKQWPCPDFVALRELYSITYGGTGETQTQVELTFAPKGQVKL